MLILVVPIRKFYRNIPELCYMVMWYMFDKKWKKKKNSEYLLITGYIDIFSLWYTIVVKALSEQKHKAYEIKRKIVCICENIGKKMFHKYPWGQYRKWT